MFISQNHILAFFVLTFFILIISHALNFFLIKLALKLNIVDNPSSNPDRKFQKKSIPLMGFAGSFIVAILLVSLVAYFYQSDIRIFDLSLKLVDDVKLIPIITGSLFIYLLGYFDDINKLSIKKYFTLLALILVITIYFAGLRIEVFSYPFNIFNLDSVPFLPYILSFVWIGVCLSSTKFLDGHDGLVSSIGIISFLTIAFISTFATIFQPLTFFIAIIWAVSLMGFLPYNLPNAKAYLGEGGSTIIGFWIGILSLISGAKVATSFSVLGWFIIDIFVVFMYRFATSKGDYKLILKGDANLHWHHRLTNFGLSKWLVLLLTIFIVSISAFLGVYLETSYKFAIFIFQLIFVLASFHNVIIKK